MSTRPPRHRVLLELGLAGDAAGIEAAALLAQQLGHELLGVFVEDEALLALAGHGFARELRLPGHGWSPIEAGEVAAEFDAAAARLRRRLEAECARLGVPAGFEVMRGEVGVCVAGLCGVADILVIGAPESAAGRAFGGFRRGWRAALESEAGVLLVPPRLARRHGPVVGLATDAEAEAMARRIAAAAGERLVLLEPPGVPHPAGREAGVMRRRVRALTSAAILEGLGGIAESLLVLPRAAVAAQDEEAAPRLAVLRRVPVLVR